jgi:translation initiation factor 6 (eIF-6)
MAVRAQFENNNEVGVFSKLTNSYCLVGIGASQSFYRYGGMYKLIVFFNTYNKHSINEVAIITNLVFIDFVAFSDNIF